MSSSPSNTSAMSLGYALRSPSPLISPPINMHPEAETEPRPESDLFNKRPNITSVPSDTKALLKDIRDANDLLDQKRIEAVHMAKVELERKYDLVEEKRKNERDGLVAQLGKVEGKSKRNFGSRNGSTKSEARRRKKGRKEDRQRAAVMGGSDEAAGTSLEDVIEDIQEEVEAAFEADISVWPGDAASGLGMIGDKSTSERDQALIDANEPGVDRTEEETTTSNTSLPEHVAIPDNEAYALASNATLDADPAPRSSHSTDATVKEFQTGNQEAANATDLVLEGEVWEYVKKLITQKTMLMALVMAKTSRTRAEIEAWLEAECEREEEME